MAVYLKSELELLKFLLLLSIKAVPAEIPVNVLMLAKVLFGTVISGIVSAITFPHLKIKRSIYLDLGIYLLLFSRMY